MKNNITFVGSLAVSWLGAFANLAADAKSIFGALAALASLIASCYAIAIARKKLGVGSFTTEDTEGTEKKLGATAKHANHAKREIVFKRKERRVRKGASKGVLALLLTAALLSGGCTHHARKLEQAQVKVERQETILREESRALTTGVVDALALAPAGSGPAVELAKALAVVDQEIEGLPLRRLPVVGALRGETNEAVAIGERVAKVPALRAEAARLGEEVRMKQETLIGMGVKFEQERNEKIARWSKWSVGLISLGGGLVALCVFVPVALPLIGRLLAWVVGKAPQLAGAMGVVGKDAFDAVVRGVGVAREELKKSNADGLKTVNGSLRAETDREHKGIIEARREALRV